MTELTTTTGLTNELAFDLDVVLGDGFTVGNLRLTDVRLNVELATHTVDENVEVQLTHTGNDGLTSLFVGLDTERRVFLSQFAQRDTHLFLVCLGLRLDSYRDNRLREVHTLEDDRLLDRAEGVTRGDVLHADQRGDVACTALLDLVTLVGVHLHHPTHALLLALDRVDYRVTGRQHTGINTSKGQGTHERVGSDLERQSGERLVITCMTLVDLLFVIRIDALNRGISVGAGR